MAKTYYIIRHGETFATINHRGYGFKVYSAPILESGIPTLERVGQYLKDKPIDFAIRSPLKRCAQTAEILTKQGNPEFVADRRLTEFFLQTFWQLKRRLTSLITDLEASPHEHILICTHGAIIAGLISLLTTKKFNFTQTFSYPDPGILTIITNTHIEQINFNKPLPK